jgi:hypothetical protein
LGDVLLYGNTCVSECPGGNLIEKLAKFDGAVPRVAFADHLPGQNVERREQRRRAMPFIVVRAPLDLSRA